MQAHARCWGLTWRYEEVAPPVVRRVGRCPDPRRCPERALKCKGCKGGRRRVVERAIGHTLPACAAAVHGRGANNAPAGGPGGTLEVPASLLEILVPQLVKLGMGNSVVVILATAFVVLATMLLLLAAVLLLSVLLHRLLGPLVVTGGGCEAAKVRVVWCPMAIMHVAELKPEEIRLRLLRVVAAHGLPVRGIP